jgi:GT2 family glycosyltransferase/glycosyltransferase involved in cell wall biosynthesis
VSPSPPFPAQLVVYGAESADAARAATLAARLGITFEFHATADGLAALRAAAERHDSVLLVAARAAVPEFALERLRRADTGADVHSALGNANPKLAPWAEGAFVASANFEAVDRGVFLAAERIASATREWLPSFSIWRRPALDWLLAHPDWRGGELPDTLAATLCDHLFVGESGLPCLGPPAPEDPRHPVPADALATLRARYAPIVRTGHPGLDGRPVVLHLLHGWGGGTEGFVRDLATADTARHHLALVARGLTARRTYGELLELALPAEDMRALRCWPLPRPIAATVVSDAGWRAVLQEIVRDFAVDALLIDSLIGHSLDAFATGLPTAVVCHDYYPHWPVLHCDFGDTTRSFDLAALKHDLCAEREPLFAERDPVAWRSLADAAAAAMETARPLLIAPSRSLQQNLTRVQPRLAALDWRIVPHGLAPFRALERAPDPPARERLRVLIAGRIGGGKGLALLQSLIPRLAAGIDFWLIGCGKAGEVFFAQRGAHLVFDYEREELPQLIARIAPDLALLAPTVAETFSYLLSELQVLAVPVLATALGSLAERIEHGRTGLLVEPDVDAIAAALEALAAERARLGTIRAVLRALPQRTAADMAREYAELLPIAAQVGPRYRFGAAAPTNFATNAFALDAYRRARERDALGEQVESQRVELETRAEWGRGIQRLLDDRTRWAKDLETQLAATRAAAAAQERELETELARVRSAREQLQQEFDERTAWALKLNEEVAMLRGLMGTIVGRVARRAIGLFRRLHVLRGRVFASLAFRSRRAAANVGRVRRSLAQRGLAGTLARAAREFQPAAAAAPLPAPEVPALEEPFQPFTVPSTDSPRVSLVIPVYNQFRHTLACLRSLAAHPGTVSFETIVVDDASNDETPARLAEIGGIVVLRNRENLGFIGTCNAGAQRARGEYIVFLNNDTAVQPGWLEALLDTFAQHADCGLAGAKLVYPDGRLQEAGGIVFNDGSGWNYGRGDDPADPAYNYLREADYCSGAAIMLRRELFERLGGFDLRYRPAYYEDTDLAFQVRAAGLRVYYQPRAVVVHFEGATSGTDTAVGIKRHQVINQESFRTRWREALAHQPAPGTPITLAREHRVRGRLLIIDACTPTPDQDSGSVRMVNLMRILIASGWKLTFFADNRLNDGRYTQALQQLGVETLYAPFLGDTVEFFRRRGAEFDAVLVARHYIARGYVALIREYARRARFVFDTVDLHYLREQRAAELADSAELRRVAARTREQELAVIRAADVTLVVSPVEKELLARDAPGVRVEVLSNVHEVAGRGRAYDARRDLFFVGGFQHPPNVDAVRWFTGEVWPAIARELHEARFHIIGSRMPPSLTALASERVLVHGQVADLTPYLDGCRLAVAPLRYGAGVKGKVNQSMAHGQPVVATSAAVEGMHLIEGEEVLVADSPTEFAAAVVRVYRDEDLWNRLSDGGLANVERHFSFAAAEAALARILPPLPPRKPA